MNLGDMEELKTCFNIFDKDSNGNIDSKELGLALRSMGLNPTEKEIMEILKKFDADNNGTIEFEEFVELFNSCNMTQEEQRQELDMAFKTFDLDSDHYLSRAELKHAMLNLGEPLTEEETDELLEMADIDGDGKINFVEFVQMMNSQ